jgi:hypothetical protein
VTLCDPSGKSPLNIPGDNLAAEKRYEKNQLIEAYRFLIAERQSESDYVQNSAFNATNLEVDIINNVSRGWTGKDAISRGGEYQKLASAKGVIERHHLVSSDAIIKSGISLKTDEAPAIIMSQADHKFTESWGNSTSATEYRNNQIKLLKDGKFKEAFENDVLLIQKEFGTKYDQQIAEAREYMNSLDETKLGMEKTSQGGNSDATTESDKSNKQDGEGK